MKVSSIGKFEVKYSFLTPHGDAINPKMDQKVKIGI